jgi:hypothetical protein
MSDYGSRGKRRMDKSVMIALGVGGLVVVGVVGSIALASKKNTDTQFAAEAQKFGVGGKPCPVVTREEMAKDGPDPTHASDYGGMHLIRAFGDVECNEIVAGGRLKICLFSSPGSLSAQAGDKTVLYLPGLGQPASVMVDEKNQLSCVLVAKKPL